MNAALEFSSRLLNSRLVTRSSREADLRAERDAAAQAKSMPLTSRRAIPNHPVGFGPYGERARQKRVYDRAKSRRRKRMMGGDGRLPNTIRSWFTEGERSVLSVIADEIKRRGKCELMVEKLAARAGVSVRLVQYTLATASWRSAQVVSLPVEDRSPLLIHVEYRPRKGGKSLPNVITIISREWINWLSYQPSEAPACAAADSGEWSVVDAFAGKMSRVLGIGCRKKHTSEIPIDLDVVAVSKDLDLRDDWQRLRLGLPLLRAYEDKSAPPRADLTHKRRVKA